MTLIASLATLMDLGRAYWVHKYDSNWIAKICLDTYRISDDNRTQRKMFCTVRKDLNTILWQVGNLSKERRKKEERLDGFTCFSSWGWASSSGIKSRQIWIEGIPATVRGSRA